MESEDCLAFEVPDDDICSPEEISSLFSHRFIEVHHSNILQNSKDSCTSLITQNEKDLCALATVNNTIHVIDKGSFKSKFSYTPQSKGITQIKFFQDQNVVCSSSLDSTLCLWDVRSNKKAKVINMPGWEKCPLTSFDISSNERIICGGTELVGRDSFLLFHDMRCDKFLGCYSECHSDDITCIKFSPSNPNLMASSATDSLINIFDVSQMTEDDALTYTLNPDDIVLNLQWFDSSKDQDILATTDVQSIELWNIENSSSQSCIKRKDITNSLRRKAEYECYVVPMRNDTVSQNPVILAASGLEHVSANCLRTLTLNQKKGVLEPHGLLVQDESNCVNSITSCALYNEKDNSYITVKENGIISMWHESGSNNFIKSSKTKKISSKSKRSNPY